MSARRAAVAVLISGRGSNLEALIDAVRDGRVTADLCAVVSNEPDAPGLARASRAGVPTRVVAHRAHARREDFDAALSGVLEALSPDLVVLAGFLRVLTPAFVTRWRGRLINIHPSLLPALPGLHTHRRALQAGLREHGASVHYVTAELDGGPVIARARVPVLPGDDPDTLAARVLAREHVLLPRVVQWIVEGRITLDDDDRVRDRGERLDAPLECDD